MSGGVEVVTLVVFKDIFIVSVKGFLQEYSLK